jgi:glycosyltransferase involved in cell wall biosynthesis
VISFPPSRRPIIPALNEQPYTHSQMRIALDCRIDDPRQGIGTAVLALAHALSECAVSDQEYTFIVHDDVKEWLMPHVFGACRLVGIPRSKSKMRRVLGTLRPLRAIWRRLRPAPRAVPGSDGYVESERFDLVHFPTQVGYITQLPTVYQPWDLQHLHYPEFFSASDVSTRERVYRALCGQARYVCVQTEWCKKDIVDKYNVDPRKIIVIPWGSVLDAHEPPSESVVQAAIKKFELPEEFFFYPAATWPHKNHSLILRALQKMKNEDGRTVHVYCTGMSTPYRGELNALAQELGVRKQFHYLGFVAPEELQAVFAAATAMIFASKFEGFGLPILEAFSARLPVLCARATVLPEVAGDAALYFDPDAPRQLVDGMQLLLDNAQLRQDLIEKGKMVLSRYSMKNTALSFQRLYERMFLERQNGFEISAASAGEDASGGR